MMTQEQLRRAAQVVALRADGLTFVGAATRHAHQGRAAEQDAAEITELRELAAALTATAEALPGLAETIRDALEGESNDADHDALVEVAGTFGIHYTPDLADAVEELGWPSVADDLRDGVPRATVLSRLDGLGEPADDVRALLEGVPADGNDR